MVGKITMTPANVCCKRVFTIAGINKNTFTFHTWRKTFQHNPFAFIFFFLFLLLLLVLYITNQPRDVYKHEDVPFNEHNIHDAHVSMFHYTVVIDCGSSGSRVYIYYWPPHTGDKKELLDIKQMMDLDGNPVRMKIKPGISSYGDNPKNASRSLQPLLQFAGDHVPHTKHFETPLFILATAGMRLLPHDKREAVLENLKINVPKMTHFHLTPSNVEVISGKQEGIYLWIATNYILGRFDHSHDISTTPSSTVAHVKRKQTTGTIEVGGASLQIAYEVPQNVSVPAELGATINLGCDVHDMVHEYQIYVTTFLGYGTDFARKSYIENMYNENQQTAKNHETLLDPCLPKDLVDEQKLNGTKFKVTGTGEYNRCKTLLTTQIEKDRSMCRHPPCSLAGRYQAPIDFAHAEFYGFAEFWYSSNDVLRVGGQYSYSVLQTAAERFCETRWGLHKRHYAMGLYPKADDFRFKYQCFKSAWVMSVLHYGLKFPYDFNGLTTVQMIKGKEVQWTLGAVLYRTRFMPLRDIQNLESVRSIKAEHYGLWIIVHSAFYPVLFLCCSISLVFIVVYCRRIRKFSRSAGFYTLQRNAAGGSFNQKAVAYDIRVDM